MNNARPATGFLRMRVGHFQYIPLNSSNNLEDELWILLEYYSETTSVTNTFLQAHGYKNGNKRKKAIEEFRAYVRQARSYYESARSLPARSSALLYYYCFLSLVKAGIVVHDPSCLGKKFYHGQKAHGVKEKLLENHTQEVKSGSSASAIQVLPVFYELYFRQPLTIKHFNILKLMGYCSEIGYQYLISAKQQLRILPAYSAIRIQLNTYWPLVAIKDFHRITPHKKSFDLFNRNFEQVALSPMEARGIFGIMAENLQQYSFFDGRQSTIRDITAVGITYTGPASDITNSLGNFLQDNSFSEDFDFFVTTPYLLRNQIPINELFSIYLVMHHISELVRYDPDVLEKMLSNKESWLIESFVRSCPATFLREIIAWIIGNNYVLAHR